MEGPDGLDILIRHSLDHDPGFADVWAPYAVMGRIVDERKRLGLTQAEVAGRMGVARSAVAKMEGDPAGVAFARVLAYARALGAELAVRPSKQKPRSPSRKGRAMAA